MNDVFLNYSSLVRLSGSDLSNLIVHMCLQERVHKLRRETPIVRDLLQQSFRFQHRHNTNDLLISVFLFRKSFQLQKKKT